MTQIPGFKPKKINRGRVDFDEEEFRRLIFNKGMLVKWEMAAACPCVRKLTISGINAEETQEPRADCPGCRGVGFIHHSPQEIRTITTTAQQTPTRFNVYGEEAAGMVGLTLLPEHLPSFLDRFTFIETVMIYRETRERGSEAVDNLRYPVVRRLIEIGDALDQEVPVEFERGVLYARSADSEGRLTDITLQEDVDFEVTTDGRIDWSLGDVLGTAPLEGERYSMHYYAHPVYLVRNHPHTHRDTLVKRKSPNQEFTPMVVKADCWLEYMGDNPNGV